MQPQNNALHQTRRRGVAASRPVVEGRLAGERECYPDARPRKRSTRNLVAVALYTNLLGACGLMAPCQNHVLGVSPSPDGEKEAIVFVRACGATTLDSTHVLVASRTSTAPSEWAKAGQGNALVVEDSVPGSSGVEAQWTSSGRLTITYEPGTEVFKQETSVLGVAIEYRERAHK